MDNTVDGSRIDPTQVEPSELTAENILANDNQDLHSKDRGLQRRWYNSLSEEEQADVRDKIRSEILRIRSELGRRTEAIYPLPVRRRDHG
jgi:hypothetical protein